MTRLVKDTNPGAYAVYVSCAACGHRIKLADALIDRDGPAYQAYYCDVHFIAHGQPYCQGCKPR